MQNYQNTPVAQWFLKRDENASLKIEGWMANWLR